LVVELAQSFPNLSLGDGGDFVDHQTACHAKTVLGIWLNDQPKQRCLGRIGREGANRDRRCGIKPIVLQDNSRSRLSRIVLSAGDTPNLAAPHSFGKSDMASTKF
jgi:hypothetical protein